MPTAVNRCDLPDAQNSKDTRNKRIERVGVQRVKVPLTIKRKEQDGISEVVNAEVAMYVSVAADITGSNMSRFNECLMSYTTETISGDCLEKIIKDMLNRLKSDDGYISIKFNYFLPRFAPVSKTKGMQGYNIEFIGKMVDNKYDFIVKVAVIGTTLCACSKQISDYGAHNQRNCTTVQLVLNDSLYWVEDIIEGIENCMSCPIFPVLKREDEKWVTEQAYENPKFVEDMVRDVAIMLDEHGIEHYHIKSAADESIHHHEAVAFLSKDWILS